MGCSHPAISFRSVVFPYPERPTSPGAGLEAHGLERVHDVAAVMVEHLGELADRDRRIDLVVREAPRAVEARGR